jgi:thiamine phosphate synthase YjbQ (UPF0047 family)
MIMKKNMIKVVMLFAMFISINTFGQTAKTEFLVKLTAMSEGAALKTLTNGKMSVFSKADQAIIVIPNNDDAATLANLEKELKALLPKATVTSRKKD